MITCAPGLRHMTRAAGGPWKQHQPDLRPPVPARRAHPPSEPEDGRGCRSSASPAGAAAARRRCWRRLIPELIARGLSVSTIKHAHHEFDIDQPGKDSWRHRQAGATEVMVASAKRWALMHELRGEPEPPLDDLVARMSPGRSLLVEGFKRQPHPEDRSASALARQAADLS